MNRQASFGWIETTIGDQVTLQRGYDITKSVQREGQVPVVSSGGISSFHDSAAAEGPGVVLGRKGVVGSVYFIDRDYWPHDTTLWVRDFRGNEPRFVYYFFKHLAPTLAAMDVGSANPTLNRNHVHPIRALWPSLHDQRTIAHILGTLDDKIELNRRMNQTLEEIARALFHSWFVAFDPVRAKAEGRQPAGMDAATAALFPDAFEASELGEIPVGWNWSTIGDAVRAVGGSTPRTTRPEYWDGDISFCTPKDLSTLNAPVLLSTGRHITNKGIEAISSGKLPAGTVLMSSRAPIGYLAISGIDVTVNQGMIAMICDNRLPCHYVYFWAKQNMGEIKGRANGTTFLEISKRNFRPLPALVPSPNVLARFEGFVTPLFDRVQANERETATLVATRDSLLPRLLSGELCVGEMATIAEQAVGARA